MKDESSRELIISPQACPYFCPSEPIAQRNEGETWYQDEVTNWNIRRNSLPSYATGTLLGY